VELPDIIDLGDNNIIGSGNAPFTVAMWIFPTRTPTGLYYFVIRLKQDAQFFLAFDSNFIVPLDIVGAIFRAQPAQWLIPIDHNALLNRWTHVAAIYNGGDKATASSFRIFFDGNVLPIGTVNLGPVGGNCNDNAIGSDSGPLCGSDFAHFEGLIDEVQIFNRILSQDEIRALAGICPTLQIAIDIKPDSDPNSINPRSKGVIPVAILTTDTFDASSVDPTTVLFGRTGTEATSVHAALEDVDGEGDTDLILHFNTQATGIQCGETSASLTGKTFDGQPIEGSDSIRTVGCK